MKKIIVLGSGMIGSAIAIDLAKDFDVTAADVNKNNFELLKNHSIKVIQADVSKPATVKKIIKDFDLVIGALPSRIGFETLKSIIEAGKNVVDISFFDEDAFQLDYIAKKKKVTAVVDCGVAPGLGNIILGYHNSKMKINSFEGYVGGLPFKRILPFQYKAPFSPKDVIEEYTRPARIVENGSVVIKPALSESELIDFEDVGTLEAFNTDGLRTLLTTMKIPHMKEKTLRYPGHLEIIKTLRESGFFSKEQIEINGMKILPIDFSSNLLFRHWKLEPNEWEFTILQIKISGVEKGKKKEYIYNLFDVFDNKTKTTSMARTTGYTCTSVARLILNGDYFQKGISPPEYIGSDEKCFKKLNQYLKDRNITLKCVEK
ncbi:MAG: saccharopine dehydrogenase NADP-binding domain-containing protein [Bacteroidetes bacterium]|nr:saccharopine dehydrogenase NADP-binding domain-containing protein [Bacteroidota bacterium]